MYLAHIITASRKSLSVRMAGSDYLETQASMLARLLPSHLEKSQKVLHQFQA